MRGHRPDLATDAALARATHGEVSQTMISAIMRGESTPTISKLDAIAAAFKVDTWLLLHPLLDTIYPDLIDAIVRIPAGQGARLRALIEAAFAPNPTYADLSADPPAPAPMLHTGRLPYNGR